MSLTPNRLRTIEVSERDNKLSVGATATVNTDSYLFSLSSFAQVTEKEAQAKRNSRRRPGTLSPLEVRAAEMNGNSPRASPLPSPAATVKSRSSQRDHDLPPTPASARGGSTGRVSGSKAPPPSSYRSPSPVVTNQSTFSSTNNQDRDGVNEDDLDDEDRELLGLPPKGKGGRRKDLSAAGVSPATSARLQPREGRNSGSGAAKEMMELFSSTPPGTPQVAQGAREDSSRTSSIHSNEGTTSKANKRASGVGGRMRNLFGRKGSGSISGTEVFFPASNRGSLSSLQGRENRPSDGGSGSGSGSARDNFSNNGHAHVSEDNLSSFADNSSSTSHSARISQQQQVGGSLGRKFSPASPPLTAIRRTSQSSQAASNSSHRPTPLNLVQSASQEDDLEADQPQIGSTSSANQTAKALSSDQQAASITGAPERVVGLYEEPISSTSTDSQSQRPATPPSPPPQSKEPPPSRKIPWSYSRQSSTGRPGSRAGATTPTSELRFSAGYGSSSGDHETVDRAYVARSPGTERDESGISGSRAAPSAWNASAREIRDRDLRDKERESSEAARSVEAGEGGKTPTPAQVLGFQGPRPRTTSASLYGGGLSGSRDTLRTLTELDRRMRSATSVEECRAMVVKALNGALESAGAFANGNGNAGAMPPDCAEIQDIPDEESDANHSRRGGFYGHGGRTSTDRKRSDPTVNSAVLANLQNRTRKASNSVNPVALPTLPISKAKRPILAMADNSAEEMMELESHGLVAAWLLDGEEPRHSQQHHQVEEEGDRLNPLASSDDVLNSGDATLIAHHGPNPTKKFSASADDTSMNNSLENDNDQDAGFASAEEDTSNGFLQPRNSVSNSTTPANSQRLSSSSLKKSPSIDNRTGGRSAVSSFYSAHED